jgi:CRISPR-associated protein Cmr6
MKALFDRQSALAETALNLLRLDAIAAAPFTTGLGNEHPLENGFAFLNPYGLPYLPGSGVKGVLRQAARELASGEWGERHGWSDERTYMLQVGKDRIPLSVIDVLFGLESGDGDTEHVRGALSFWDVIPQVAGDSLMVEIMTPHQSHYYQQKPAAGSTSPHDSGAPNPISFLTVPPGSAFTFHVVCNAAHLARLTQDRHDRAPDLLAEGDTHWQILLKHAFLHAFDWLGFGAKTAVGYGAMKTRHGVADHGQATSQEQAVTVGRRASGVALVQAQDTIWPTARLVLNPGTGEIKASFEGKTTAGLKGPEADALRAALGDRANKLKKDRELKNVAVRVRIEGNMTTLLGLATPEQ